MRLASKIAATTAAAALSIGIAGTVAPAAQAASWKPMTVDQANEMGWWLYEPTITGNCVKLYLSPDKKIVVATRNSTPSEECAQDDHVGRLNQPNTITVSRVVRDDIGAPGLQGVLTSKGYNTKKQWKSWVKFKVKPSKADLNAIMRLSKSYLLR